MSTGTWTSITSMEIARREHACLYVEFEETKGILVTGGNLTNREYLFVTYFKHALVVSSISIGFSCPTAKPRPWAVT